MFVYDYQTEQNFDNDVEFEENNLWDVVLFLCFGILACTAGFIRFFRSEHLTNDERLDWFLGGTVVGFICLAAGYYCLIKKDHGRLKSAAAVLVISSVFALASKMVGVTL